MRLSLYIYRGGEDWLHSSDTVTREQHFLHRASTKNDARAIQLLRAIPLLPYIHPNSYLAFEVEVTFPTVSELGEKTSDSNSSITPQPSATPVMLSNEKLTPRETETISEDWEAGDCAPWTWYCPYCLSGHPCIYLTEYNFIQFYWDPLLF